MTKAIRRIPRKNFGFIIACCLFFESLLLPLSAYAQEEVTWENCTEGGADQVATLQCLEPVFGRIISFAAGGALIAFFVMFVISALKYLTSGGDPKQSESARNTMTYAFIGIIVIVSAYIIIRFLEAFTGLNLSTFTIPKPGAEPVQ